ncbi:MAG: hypothetical protein UT48_C0001G0005 [Parcubacteria group bacterium GW2011_GWE2_39_37]|uniref:Uncharacterized protein n=1 Tax=Candidatus Falkowbacteria bacterium GW2011_GWF2_39_8 TaxID=1618642 RepID=A0A0G0Q6C9_9BACT|nr:MAG: hypothetical protein UT48_C0001G0005 [Parcubacteria group bacterium GW2011_GWE2_39_37]KKR32906.1 MAG: hypothetical protein UT64_C0019G0012 [Candidatus Falkowbacteria bacterium GW2011_GWF2_39_8]
MNIENQPETFTPWDEFNPLEYAEQNYGQMLPEDENLKYR